jgi:hypothetical protein
MSRLEEGYAKTLRELRAEQASALGRIGRTLEATLEELHALRTDLAGSASPPLEPLLDRQAALLARARLYRYFLEVQREAIGLRDHSDLDRHYPPPDGSS